MPISWYYVFTVLVIGMGGIPKVPQPPKSFVTDFDLEPSNWKKDPTGLANRIANISSILVLGAAFGALISLKLADMFGRLRCWQLFVITWASGLFMQVFSSGIYGLIVAARLISGLGAGGLTVVAPLYLSEVAPARSRGMIVSIYMLFLLTVLSAGFFINYGASKDMAPTRTQYRLVQSIPLIPMGFAFIGSMFITDTPRWFASEDRTEKATNALSRLRNTDINDPNIAEEYSEALQNCQARQQHLKSVSVFTIIKEIATISSFRERFLLGIFMQTVAQWSGGNGITYYIPKIFTYAGVKTPNQSLITSGAYGIFKLVFTMVFTWALIDKLGRRWCLLAGLFLEAITDIYMAIYMAKWRATNNTSASDAAIASVFIYAVGWSIGLCTVQYLYTTEIYPTRIRSVCYSVNMTLHWFFQFAIVRVTPVMFATLEIYGAYIFWAIISLIGFVGLAVWAPETKNVPMERMEELFGGRWWNGWRAKIDLTQPPPQLQYDEKNVITVEKKEFVTTEERV